MLDKLYTHYKEYWPHSNKDLAQMNSNEYIPATQPEEDDGDDGAPQLPSAGDDLGVVDDVELAKALGVPDKFIARMSPNKSRPATPLQTMAPHEKVPENVAQNPEAVSMDRQRRIEILKCLFVHLVHFTSWIYNLTSN